jgi:hypothetical protein
VDVRVAAESIVQAKVPVQGTHSPGGPMTRLRQTATPFDYEQRLRALEHRGAGRPAPPLIAGVRSSGYDENRRK